MKIKILGSALLIDNKLLVDTTQLLKEKTIEAVLITHAHSDIIAGLNQIEKYMKNDTIDVYSFRNTINILKQKLNKDFINYIKIEPDEEYDILGYKIIPYSVNHSVIFRMFNPAVAYQINNIIYCGNIDQEFFMSNVYRMDKLKRVMAKSSLTFLDGILHKNNSIQELAKWQINNVYFTGIAHTNQEHEKLMKNVNFKNPTYNICYDGMVINVTALKDKLNQITKDMQLDNLNDTDLIGVHSVLHVWYLKGKTEWSKEDIWNLHKRIMEDMEKKGMKHIPKDILDKNIQPHTTNLLDGFHAMIKKKGDNVSIIAESGKNIMIGFPISIEDIKKLAIKEEGLPRGKEGLPFAGYKNFAECVSSVMAKKGWPKERASAYCAVIKRKVEDNNEQLSAKLDGIIMVEPHGKMIWEGNKKLIVKSEQFDIASKFFYLIENDRCYGIIKITSVEKMTPELFEEMHYLHQISDDEKKKWWGDLKEFWAYQFNMVTRYSTPLKIKPPQGMNDFIKGENIEKLENLSEFNQILGPNDKPIRDFPLIFQEDFKYVMDKKLNPNFIMQQDGNYTDIKLEIPNKNYLLGVTLINVEQNEIITKLKSQLKSLSIEGLTIISKGNYSIWQVNDHKIGIEFNCDKIKKNNLRDLTGQFSFTISHIQPEKWIGFFNHLKSKPVPIKMFDNPYVQEILEQLSLALGNQPVLHKLTFDSGIKVELGSDFKMPYEFNFIALKEGEFNGIWYSEEELKKGHLSLKGKDVTIDHSKSVRDVVGKITDVWWNNELKQIEGKGIIDDEEIAKKVHDKIITGVSVEVYVTYYESEHGRSAKDPQFVAISLVTSPACRTCRIVPKTCQGCTRCKNF